MSASHPSDQCATHSPAETPEGGWPKTAAGPTGSVHSSKAEGKPGPDHRWYYDKSTNQWACSDCPATLPGRSQCNHWFYRSSVHGRICPCGSQMWDAGD